MVRSRGPGLFTAAWLVAGAVQDMYSPRREDISALAALDAQHASIMIAGIVALGMSLVALSLGLVGAVNDCHSAIVGAILLVLAVLMFVLAGVARDDCSSELRACKKRVDAGDVSWHHKVHDNVGIAVFLVLVLAPLVLARAFRGDSRWRDLRRYSLATGAVTLVLLVVFGGEPFSGWNGFAERILVTIPLVLIAVLGRRLARIADAPDPAA